MRRRDLVSVLVWLGFCRSSIAQGNERVYRIGYLWLSREGTDETPIQGLRDGLKELGYLEGKNLVLEARYADEDIARLPHLVAELVNLKVDLIRTPGVAVTLAAARGAPNIPIVATMADPISVGAAASLARPGRNVTGVSLTATPEMASKRLEILVEAVPALRSIAFLYDVGNASSGEEREVLLRVAGGLGIGIVPVPVRNFAEIEPGFDELRGRGVGALIVDAAPFITGNRAVVLALAARYRLPAIYARSEYLRDGGLFTYGAHLPEVQRRVVQIIDGLLRGASPSDIPFEHPTQYALGVNLRTARALGIDVPPSLLARADEVIE